MTCIQKEEEAKNVNDHRYPIKRIPDELWDEIKNVLPKEKSSKTVGRPIVPYRKVLDGILYVLRTGCQWKMLPKEHGSGSTCHRRFQEWNGTWMYSKTFGLNCWKYMMKRLVLTGYGSQLILYL